MKLRQLKGFCGSEASIYTVLKSDGKTCVSEFIEEWIKDFEPAVVNFVSRLKSIGTVTGATENFFRLNEGNAPDDLVCALHDLPEMRMRLYCIRLTDKIVIVGGGGPKNVRAWQEDPKLKKAAEFMISVSGWVRRNISNGDLEYSEDGLTLVGKLDLP